MDYKIALGLQDIVSVQRTIENFNWQYAFERKTINEKIQVLSEVLMNMPSNFVSHKWFSLIINNLHGWNPKLFILLTLIWKE